MSEPTRFEDDAEEPDHARGLREDPPTTVEEELERERQGTFAEGQEEVPHEPERIEPAQPMPGNVRSGEDPDPIR